MYNITACFENYINLQVLNELPLVVHSSKEKTKFLFLIHSQVTQDYMSTTYSNCAYFLLYPSSKICKICSLSCPVDKED